MNWQSRSTFGTGTNHKFQKLCSINRLQTVIHQFAAYIYIYIGGHAVAQLIEALRYKPGGRGFDSRWCHWNFSLAQSFQSHYGHGVDSASNRNKYQEYFLGRKGGRCVRLTTSPLACAECHENLGA